jgi:orotidine-5'-phosphate decarboxylase
MAHSCELILALDVPDREAAKAILDRLEGEVPRIKIGLQLFCRYGPAFVEEIAKLGAPVFLDLKLHDIPNTVAKAVSSVGDLPVDMLTIHGSGGVEMMEAANLAAEAANPDLKLFAITVLTSMDRAELAATGVDDSPADQVVRIARLARESGIPGLVCSGLELMNLTEVFHEDLPLFLTPGIRPEHTPAGDQKRVLTPAEAALRGSNYIVVGRPILEARDPAAAIAQIRQELANAGE